MTQIYATHVHADEKFDADFLFIVAENILKRATQIVDNIVLGTVEVQENLEEKAPKATFSAPLCTLKQLSYEMACQTPGEVIAHRTCTTMLILYKLSSYSWDAKAVMMLAAFAFEYGDFRLLAQLPSSDQLAKLVGILKRAPDISKLSGLQKYKKAIVELNNLIKDTLKVIESMFELEKLSTYDTKDVPELAIAMSHIPIDVYWAIITIIACTTQMCCVTSDGDTTQELTPFAQKINHSLNSLKMHISLCHQQKEQIKAYKQLKKIIRTHTEIMEVLKELIFAKDNLQEIFYGSTKQRVSIEVLRKNNVLLFFSGLDISTDDILILKSIDDGIRTKDQYKILWIPIVEKWTDELKMKFETLQSKMSWYIVQTTEPIVGIRFIKEEWKFENQPILVVMNPQGQVEHTNALHMIRAWGMKAFPFTKKFEEQSLVVKESNWFGDIMVGIDHPNLQEWIKEEKYVFFYGGKDNEWIQQFVRKATSLANNKETNISINFLCLENGKKGENDVRIRGQFWSKIESLFFSAKTYKETEQNTVMREIQKLLSFKNESGWAILSKGSKVVVSDIGTKISKALDDFEKEKGNVRDMGFDTFFKTKLDQGDHPCCSVDIPFIAGNIPNQMKCHHCLRVMETYLSFKCCHIN
ncbi:protein SIEVE ELEMENT OCCLUSION B-like [Corylus avellana]|uniref:protein SIEVE ELEMENT OCCLUSION B-like n=1 Tax=Corylus avellana TaxID=13451 RepID=UPI00286D3332|nr:protein SIEVE ELEMENT OCCLUSION B-like [Corylus avellana]